jgi:exodeoxyribonuclease-3
MFKVATWNVNSIKVRLPQVLDWLKKNKPDVFCLQETKSTNEHFPKEDIEKEGFHVVFSGQKTYNGVAVITKKNPKDIMTDLPNLNDDERRVLAVTIDDWRILNIYVPNGQEVGSEKYQYKLNWLKQLNSYIQEQLKIHKKLLILGDFNIAPEDRDVYDPKAWEGHVLVSPKERTALKSIEALGLTDAFRLFHEESGLYSWWDYRSFGFRRNAGLRLDLILMNEEAEKYCVSCDIDVEPRKNERPSDHTPVVATFECESS